MEGPELAEGFIDGDIEGSFVTVGWELDKSDG